MRSAKPSFRGGLTSLEFPHFPSRMSVAIPFHRLDGYLIKAIKSVSGDCQLEDEILLINDSGENSDAVNTWMQSHKIEIPAQVRIIDNKSGGIVSARNIALKYSKNEYLSFLDSDDTWVSGRRDCHLAALKNSPEISGVSSNVRYTCPHGKNLSQSQISHPALEKLLSPIQSFFPRFRTSATTIRVSRAVAVGGFKESESACEDFGMWLRLHRDRGGMLADCSIGAHYTIHADQISNKIAGMALKTHQSLTLHALKESNLKQKRKRVAVRRIIKSIESGGLISLMLGYSQPRPLRFTDFSSPTLLLLGFYLHLTARSYRRSPCTDCEL